MSKLRVVAQLQDFDTHIQEQFYDKPQLEELPLEPGWLEDNLDFVKHLDALSESLNIINSWFLQTAVTSQMFFNEDRNTDKVLNDITITLSKIKDMVNSINKIVELVNKEKFTFSGNNKTVAIIRSLDTPKDNALPDKIITKEVLDAAFFDASHILEDMNKDLEYLPTIIDPNDLLMRTIADMAKEVDVVIDTFYDVSNSSLELVRTLEYSARNHVKNLANTYIKAFITNLSSERYKDLSTKHPGEYYSEEDVEEDIYNRISSNYKAFSEYITKRMKEDEPMMSYSYILEDMMKDTLENVISSTL
jgi:hypothetical protein